MLENFDFNKDGTLIAFGSGDIQDIEPDDDNPRLEIYDSNTRELKVQLNGHRTRVSAVAFNPVNNTIISGDYNGEIRIWNVTC